MSLPITLSPALHGGDIVVPDAAAILLDAAEESVVHVGYVWTSDGGSHTIDTSGSSSIGWKTGAITFANAGTTVKVGLAALDLATGPPARAANVANVITFDVSKSHTGGGGGITDTAWQTNVPDAGTKTIANGDLVAFGVQMTARGGADSVLVQHVNTHGGIATILPTVTSYTGAAYAATTGVPNCVITFSDGALGYFFGGYVFLTTQTGVTWNSGSATKEYGNYLQFPAPVYIHGIAADISIGGDVDFVLYSDPLGTPVAEKTISVDANAIGITGNARYMRLLFSTPYLASANQPLAVIMKPGGTNTTSRHVTLNAAANMAAYPLGTNCYAVNRASGAFAAQNSSKDRFGIAVLVEGAVGGGLLTHSGMTGGIRG